MPHDGTRRVLRKWRWLAPRAAIGAEGAACKRALDERNVSGARHGPSGIVMAQLKCGGDNEPSPFGPEGSSNISRISRKIYLRDDGELLIVYNRDQLLCRRDQIGEIGLKTNVPSNQGRPETWCMTNCRRQASTPHHGAAGPAMSCRASAAPFLPSTARNRAACPESIRFF